MIGVFTTLQHANVLAGALRPSPTDQAGTALKLTVHVRGPGDVALAGAHKQIRDRSPAASHGCGSASRSAAATRSTPSCDVRRAA